MGGFFLLVIELFASAPSGDTVGGLDTLIQLSEGSRGAGRVR